MMLRERKYRVQLDANKILFRRKHDGNDCSYDHLEIAVGY